MLGETSLHISLWRETDTSFCFVSLSIFSTNLNKSVIKFLIFHSKSQAGSCIILIGKIYFSAWNLCNKGWQNIILQGINLSSWLQLWWLWESFNVQTQYFPTIFSQERGYVLVLPWNTCLLESGEVLFAIEIANIKFSELFAATNEVSRFNHPPFAVQNRSNEIIIASSFSSPCNPARRYVRG